jgi:hypothetical protein
MIQVIPKLCPSRFWAQCEGVDDVANLWWEVHEAKGLLRVHGVGVRFVGFGFMVWAAGEEVGEFRLWMTRSCFRHFGGLLEKVDDSLRFAGRLLSAQCC